MEETSIYVVDQEGKVVREMKVATDPRSLSGWRLCALSSSRASIKSVPGSSTDRQPPDRSASSKWRRRACARPPPIHVGGR